MNDHILVIDDDKGILEVVKIILEDKGYHVEVLENSSDILQYLKNNIPNLILLDIWMSGMDGQKIMEFLKKGDVTKNIPVILMSANQDTEKIAKKTGANAYITKPFDIDSLTQMVDSFINK